jgi:hypothetical protein
MGIFSKGIFSKLLRHRLAAVLMFFIMVITLLDAAQLALHGAKADAHSPAPLVRCHGDKPCSFLASTGFSGIQGQDQWTYLFSQDQEQTFAPMTYDRASTQWHGAWQYCAIGTNLSQSGSIAWQHPGTGCDSVRTWVAPGTGSATLTANGVLSVAASVAASCQGNISGVQIRVLKNGTQLWPATGWQVIPNGGTFSFPAVTTSVQAADQIHFVVAHVGSFVFCDSTFWDQLVTFMPA